MNKFRSYFSFLFIYCFAFYSTGCIDTTGPRTENDDESSLNAFSTVKPLSSDQLKNLTNKLKQAATIRPCSRLALMRQLNKSITEFNGIPYTQIDPLFRELTDPTSRMCDGQSCNRPFGLKMYEVPKFLAAAKQVAEAETSNVAELRASLTPPRDGGKWLNPNIEGANIITGKGTMIVYTYQRLSDFETLVGKKPDLSNSNESQDLAEALLLKKMMMGAEGNQKIDNYPILPANAVQGFGLYVSNDPMQSPMFGEVLIEFEISLEAHYTINKLFSGQKKDIKGNQFGIIYDYTAGVSGNKALVLRFDPNAHPLAQPIIPGSVKLYPNTIYDGSGSKKVDLNFESLNVLSKRQASKSGNPARDFMARYGDHLKIFDIYMSLKSSFPRYLIRRDEILLDQIKRDLEENSQLANHYLNDLRKEARTNHELFQFIAQKADFGSFESRKYEDTAYFKSYVINLFFEKLWSGGKDNLLFLIKIAKGLELIHQSLKPMNKAVLRDAILAHSLSKESKDFVKTTLNQMYNDWIQVVDFWKKNNIDAFAYRERKRDLGRASTTHR